MFIEILFIVAKKWKPPKCPWRDEWIKKVWYKYNRKLYFLFYIVFSLKKERSLVIGNNKGVPEI